MRFSDIHGHQQIKSKLVAAVQNNHLAHALLFHGNEGSANLVLALALATYLNCDQPTGDDACGQCPSCIKNSKFIHPDLGFAVPVSGGEKIVTKNYLKEWRDFMINKPFGNHVDWSATFNAENKNLSISRQEGREIIQSLSLKSFEGKYKIMLIWLPEFFHSSTANGLLKVIEEPPEKTIFLLVSNNEERLLTTVLSRTQKIKVPAYNDEEIREILIQKGAADEIRLPQIVQLADGNLREAYKLCEELEDDNHAFFVAWMRECYGYKAGELINKAEHFNKMGKVAQQNYLNYCLSALRETLIFGQQLVDLQRVTEKDKAFYEKFSTTLNPDKIERMASLLNEASYHLERNAHVKLLFLDVSFKMGAIFRS